MSNAMKHMGSCAQLVAVPGWSKGVVPLRAHCSKPSPRLLDPPWTQGKQVQVGSPEIIRSLSGNNAYKLPTDHEIQPRSVKNAENAAKKK